MMKRFLYSLLSLSLLTSLVSCGTTSEVKDGGEEMERPVIIGMANPFTYPKNITDAELNVGFDITLPAEELIPSWVEETIYKTSVVNMKLIEVIYAEDESCTREIRIRKGIVDNEDISGDFNSYEKTLTKEIEGKTVTLNYEKDLIKLATWGEGEYKYSLHTSDGMDLETISKYISSIN